jgi:type I restriction enzyme S subunit
VEVRPGYKQTEVGVIPEDWDAVPLSVIGQFKNGINKGSEAFGYGAPFVNLMDVFGVSSIRSSDGLGLVKSSDAEQKTYDLKRGDVIFIRSSVKPSGVGLTAVVEADLPRTVYSGFLIRFRDNDALDIGFKRHCFYSENFRSRLIGASTVSANTNINQDNLKKLLIALPPTIDEQRAIATVLSDVDTLLNTLDRLIAKKRAIKQAAMQALLSGKTRLPGFSGEWKVRRLGDIAHIKTGKRNNEDKVGDGLYPFFVRSANVERINTYSHDCEAILVPGEGKIENTFHYINGRFDVHQRVYAITQFATDVFGRYVHLYMSLRFGAWAMQNTVKATVDSLRLPTFQSFEVRLPPTFAEQTAIAAILSDMDAELATLETRRDKTHGIKQAMMQELLTGKTRLVKPGIKAGKETTVQTSGRQANVHFIRSVLAAEIIDQLHAEPTFGHVKFEKVMFLTEHLCGIDTGSTYYRQAAGPYDNWALRSIDSQLRKQKWFDAHKEDRRYIYLPLEKRGGHKQYFERYFSDIRPAFEKIVATFKKLDTEKCEIVATLFAVWNDLLHAQKIVSDEAIVHEVLNNWHESKKRIPEQRWLKALDWMREQGVVPREAAQP